MCSVLLISTGVHSCKAHVQLPSDGGEGDGVLKGGEAVTDVSRRQEIHRLLTATVPFQFLSLGSRHLG